MSDLVQALRSRRTDKVLADPENPLPADGNHCTVVDNLLADAAWAPFHYPAGKSHRHEFDSPVPWRFYKVNTAGCRKLATQLNAPDSGAGKIAAMLAGADVLIQVTWLPDPGDAAAPVQTKPTDTATPFIGSQRNMEHIAAAAAAVQSFLLLATGAGYRTYWSSGGILRSPELFSQLSISTAEVLLGSVFLFPQDIGAANIKPGAWRDKRGAITDWSAWREI